MCPSDGNRAFVNSTGAQTGRLHDREGRRKKAAKMLAALGLVIPDTTPLRLLDAGCASGIITRALAPHFAFAAGIDFDEAGLRRAETDAGEPAERATLMRATTAALPFGSSTFDVVICAQVYEHVADQRALVDEIFRVMKPGGWCFFSGPNRTWPIEDHYKLPGLGWLPRKWAGAYLRLTRRGTNFEENLLTSAQLQQLFFRFERFDITPQMIRNPNAFHIVPSPVIALTARLPERLARRLDWIYPNPNWLLRKPAETSSPRQPG